MLAVLSPANPRVHGEGFEPSSYGFKARRLTVSLSVIGAPPPLSPEPGFGIVKRQLGRALSRNRTYVPRASTECYTVSAIKALSRASESNRA